MGPRPRPTPDPHLLVNLTRPLPFPVPGRRRRTTRTRRSFWRRWGQAKRTRRRSGAAWTSGRRRKRPLRRCRRSGLDGWVRGESGCRGSGFRGVSECEEFECRRELRRGKSGFWGESGRGGSEFGGESGHRGSGFRGEAGCGSQKESEHEESRCQGDSLWSCSPGSDPRARHWALSSPPCLGVPVCRIQEGSFPTR